MAPSSSFFSSSFTYEWSYDVFLNFRGSDTRYSFTGNLYKALCDKGIRTFIDDEELQRGEAITPSLVKAIQQSRIAIPIFSTNYAASSFCLDELAAIMKLVKGKGRLVFPIFYDVEPSKVRHQRGAYAEALARHEERFKDDKEKVLRWREALHQATNFSGEDFRLGNQYEYVFIEKIVKEIVKRISRVPLHVANYPVGLESRVLEVNSLLNDGSDGGVHMVGLYGIGGIGKTTLARAVYNMIADQFEGLCFLENVRENSIKHGLAHLQETLLFEILGDRDIKLISVNKGISIIKHRLHNKKILLVLDDVDKLEQLQAIVGRLDWFGSGSRVIITTRDKHLLATHRVDREYEVYGLNKEEGLELLSWNAFKYGKADPSFMDIIKHAVTYACGHPLALEVIGSNLFGKSMEEWRSALDQYRRIPNKDIQKILKISFDDLEEYQQAIFLDIACCFKGYNWVEVKDILHTCHDACLNYGIRVLEEKSLIKINEYGCVTLHDLIQDMGRETIRLESPKNPGKRSRLWLHEDIVQVLEENTGTSEIEIMILDAPIYENVLVEWDGEAFKKMSNLKILIIKNTCFFQGANHLPNSLRVLEWWGYPSNSLPIDFHPKKLAILNLPHSNLMSVSFLETRKFMNLKIMNVRFSNIGQIPDVSGAPNLEELYFDICESLVKVHESVGFLKNLRYLCANGCDKLRNFPPLMLPSLEFLDFTYCSSLENFPEILGKMEYITHISLEGTSIAELPSSIENLSNLENLNLIGCGILQLPSSIVRLPNLIMLYFSDFNATRFSLEDEGIEQGRLKVALAGYVTQCSMFQESFSIALTWFHTVTTLNLSGNNFTVIPESFQELCSLKALCLNNCKMLREIKGIPPNIESFAAANCTSLTSSSRSMILSKELHEDGEKTFYLPGSRIPEWFDQHRSKQDSVSFWFRNKLPVISLCVIVGPVVSGTDEESFHYALPYHMVNHIIVIDQITIKSNVDELVLSENEWNHVVCRFTMDCQCVSVKEIGIHLHAHNSNKEDIRITDPLLQREEVGQRNWLPLLDLPLAINSMNVDVDWNSSFIALARICSNTYFQDMNGPMMCFSASEALILATVLLAISTKLFATKESIPSLMMRSFRQGRKSHQHLSRQLKSQGLP